MENLKQLFDRLLAREIERNQMLADSGYADFAISDDSVMSHALEVFQRRVTKQMGENMNGNTR
tara:strand:- start:260 stop:448 length:189 start_codon:yes stop_codon:yes gene_type:complete